MYMHVNSYSYSHACTRDGPIMESAIQLKSLNYTPPI